MTKTPRAILVIFCLLLLAPAAGDWLALDVLSKNLENRNLAARPEFAWSKSFPRRYQEYFNDSFGFRSPLVYAHNYLRFKLLGVSPSPLVVIGKDGWLYYTGEGNIEDCRGITRFSEEQLHRWAQALVLKKTWLARQGVRHLVVIPPNKGTIYPEYLPEGYTRVRDESGIDDYLDYLRKHTDIEIVDLRGVLLQHKNRDGRLLYWKNDTHWNEYGAFYAYQEIMMAISRWYESAKIFELSDFDIVERERPYSDLDPMFGYIRRPSDISYEFKPKRPFRAMVSSETGAGLTGFTPAMDVIRAPYTMTIADVKLPKIVVFRDSFFTDIVPFLSEHFSSSRNIWARWDSRTPMEEIVAKYQPDIIMEEIVERLIKRDSDVFAEGIPDYLAKTIMSTSDGTNLNYDQVKVGSGATLKINGSELHVNVTDSDPQLLLNVGNHIDSRNDGLILHIDIDSQHDTMLQIFYKLSSDMVYSEKHSIVVNLHKGVNQIRIPLIQQNLSDTLRFDPACHPGLYTVTKLQISPVNLLSHGLN